LSVNFALLLWKYSIAIFILLLQATKVKLYFETAKCFFFILALRAAEREGLKRIVWASPCGRPYQRKARRRPEGDGTPQKKEARRLVELLFQT
jgi:hypothetical protein